MELAREEDPSAPEPPPPPRTARFAWAMLLARIYEVLPLVCPRCGGAMRILAFVTKDGSVRRVLEHLGGLDAGAAVALARSALAGAAGSAERYLPRWYSRTPTPPAAPNAAG